MISVALCTYNGSRFIRDQIRSICLQSLPPNEIVLSDDASTDDCVLMARATLENVLRDHPCLHIELRVVKNRLSLGVTKNFEQAVMLCHGDLVALCDQDDVWHPKRLARMVSEFQRRPDLLLLHTDARLVGAGGEDLKESLFDALEVRTSEISRIHGGQAFDIFLRRNLVTGATTLFRKSLLGSAFPFPTEWLHDEWLAIIASSVGRVDVHEGRLIDYRQHENNQIGAQRETFIQKVKRALTSRGTTHTERAIKTQILLDRLLMLGDQVALEVIEKVKGKIEHQLFRATLPAARIRRFFPVLKEAATGRYEKFGRGARGVIRDLFESV